MQIAPRKELSLFDSNYIIIVAGIYKTAPTVAANTPVVSGVHPLKMGVL